MAGLATACTIIPGMAVTVNVASTILTAIQRRGGLIAGRASDRVCLLVGILAIKRQISALLTLRPLLRLFQHQRQRHQCYKTGLVLHLPLVYLTLVMVVIVAAVFLTLTVLNL